MKAYETMAKRDYSATGVNTRLAHSGNDPHDYFGFVNPPVVHASTVLFPDASTLASRQQKYVYGTHNTPTSDALAAAINELEGSAGTIMVPSGLAAVTVPLLGFLSAGDHVLIVDSVYGPTRRFADTMLVRLGVEVEYYDPLIGGAIASLMQIEHESGVRRITRHHDLRGAGHSRRSSAPPTNVARS